LLYHKKITNELTIEFADNSIGDMATISCPRTTGVVIIVDRRAMPPMLIRILAVSMAIS